MNTFLVAAGTLSAIAALMHVGCIVFGASWYRFFGAGEKMALLAEQKSIKPALITSAIVAILSVWALYAYSAATLSFALPYPRIVLVLITLVYLVRGLAGLLLIKKPMGNTPRFWLWSSVICLLIGLIHLVGLSQQWPNL
ncbi:MULTISPECIES: hypothetical protein [unclassified Agarivorans]|uniref:hypothetical protein n=1 Tax=unclassified Agarivorans TaxID=2636026 RepID=UPI0026E2D30E|nr:MULTISPECIES: hypothetical protein [unclassified Agarivorans]MDO6685949.1 hypothetical protein [Agarivorans sp. 3_MG-2023]MDO6713913.1 hypothetical protein [Agarivorans sp. 2_MG-2023]